MAQATRTTARRARSADQADRLMEEKLTEALKAGKAPKNWILGKWKSKCL